MYLHIFISYDFVFSKIYDKRDFLDFDTISFPFLDGVVPRRPRYGVYISQLITFTRVCSHVEDLMLVINVLLLNFSNRVNSIISLERLFPNSKIAKERIAKMQRSLI